MTTDYQTLIAEARAGTLVLPDHDDRPRPVETSSTGQQLVILPPSPPPAEKPQRLALPDRPDDYVWDRLQGEPQHWYDRFNEFLKMPYDPKTKRRTRRRRVIEVFRGYWYKKNPDRPAPSAPHTGWVRAVQVYRWYERADAYDKWYDEEQRRNLLNQVTQKREDRETNLMAVRGILAQRVLTMTEQEIKALPPAVVISALTQINRELRAESEQALEVDGRVLEQENEDDQVPFKAYGTAGGDWIDKL